MGNAMGPMGGLMPMLAASQRNKLLAREAAKAGSMRGRPMAEEVMIAEEAPAGGAGIMVGREKMQDKQTFKKGGKVKKMAKGGSVSSASKRADGCATKGKTKGRFV